MSVYSAGSENQSSRSGTRSREERRAWPRENLTAPVSYAVRGRSFQEFIQNISQNGIFATSSFPFSPGDEVVVAFTDPRHGKNVKTGGFIVRVTPRGIGIQLMAQEPRQPTGRKNPTERRSSPRLKTHEGMFVILNAPVQGIGEILDIGARGLGFVYESDEPLSERSYTIDIMSPEAGFLLKRVSVESRSDLTMDGGRRRQGVRFRKLGPRQLSELELLRRKIRERH